MNPTSMNHLCTCVCVCMCHFTGRPDPHFRGFLCHGTICGSSFIKGDDEESPLAQKAAIGLSQSVHHGATGCITRSSFENDQQRTPPYVGCTLWTWNTFHGTVGKNPKNKCGWWCTTGGWGPFQQQKSSVIWGDMQQITSCSGVKSCQIKVYRPFSPDTCWSTQRCLNKSDRVEPQELDAYVLDRNLPSWHKHIMIANNCPTCNVHC